MEGWIGVWLGGIAFLHSATAVGGWKWAYIVKQKE